MDITATVWTLLPPIIAIALALITKEVYSSLLIGILAGALLYTGFNPLHAVETTFEIMGGKLGDNINICIFLVLLGILVSLVTKSGASRAYGEWAVKTIKSRRGASFATSFLGIFIFVDDYFNCLTVGTVMRPVTDKYSITRAKLAYIIDATAAPVCIIAPISSWAAAVGSSLPESSTTREIFSMLRPQTATFRPPPLALCCKQEKRRARPYPLYIERAARRRAAGEGLSACTKKSRKFREIPLTECRGYSNIVKVLRETPQTTR